MQAADGLKLSGGATYDTVQSNICLMGGTLTLNTMEHSLLNFTSTFDGASEFGLGDSQLVLFSGVGGVYFGTDGIDYCFFVNMFGKRKLNQNTVDVLGIVKNFD